MSEIAGLLASEHYFFVVINFEGYYTYVNPYFQKFYSFLGEDFSKIHFKDTVHPDDFGRCSLVGEKCLKEPGKCFVTEMRKPTPGGGFSWTRWEFMTHLNEQGEVDGLQGIGSDISEDVNRKSELIRYTELYTRLNDSVAYAQRIQNSILPDEELFNRCFKDYFLLNMPRDTVSGDFFWLRKFRNQLFVVVGDCTGHGVPGAMMSMLSLSIIEKIIRFMGIHQPDLILYEINNSIRQHLKQENNNNKDGLEMGIGVFDLKNKKLNYAGANFPLYIAYKDRLEAIKTSKKPIGGSQPEGERIFESKEIDLADDMTFYLFTDGLKDQLKIYNKIMPRRVNELLFKNSALTFSEQKNALQKLLEKGERQLDDITCLGFKV